MVVETLRRTTDAAAPDSVFLYEGKNDLFLKDTPFCLNCGNKGATNRMGCGDSQLLLPCPGGCEMVHYCSSECQKKDLSNHHGNCVEIQKSAQQVREEEAKLQSLSVTGVVCTTATTTATTTDSGSDSVDNSRSSSSSVGPHVVDAFSALAGRFWDVMETRDYMKARLRLAEHMAVVAHQVNTVQGWEAVKLHYQEMMRLCQCDNLGLRFRFALILVMLHRDDDAYAFCIDWFQIDHDFWGFRYGVRRELHATSQPGDYLFLRPDRPNVRHGDLFAQCPCARSADSRLFLLVAVAVIKMRLVAQYESYQRVMQTLFANEMTSRGKQIAQVAPLISDMLVGDTQTYIAKMKLQREQLNHLLDSIEQRNPTVLKALLGHRHCRHQQQQQQQQQQQHPGNSKIARAYVRSSSDPLEAYIVLDDARRCLERIPGAMELLANRL